MFDIPAIVSGSLIMIRGQELPVTQETIVMALKEKRNNHKNIAQNDVHQSTLKFAFSKACFEILHFRVLSLGW